MKRIICLVVLGLFLCSTAFAWQWGGSDALKVNFSTYVCDNTTGLYQKTAVSKATIVPGVHCILGYAIMPLSANSENIVALHDAENTDPYVDESLIDEAETPAATMSAKWFAYPKKLSVGLTLRQGAQTRVIVYYTTI